jgi:acetyl esterase
VARKIESALVRMLGALPGKAQQKLSRGGPIERDGQTLAPEIQLLLQLIKLRGGPGLTDLPVDESRRKYRSDVLVSSGAPVSVGAVRDLEIPGATGPLRARHYLPRDSKAPLLVFLHGGGFVLGDLDTHDAPCRFLCREGPLQILSVEYRLSPEHPYPAAIEDACAAFAWARRELGAEAVGGDSAGAHLAAAVAQLAEEQPALQLLIYPAIDRVQPWPSLELFAEGFPLSRKDVLWFELNSLAPGAQRGDPRGSLLASGKHAKLAPAIVAVAGFDPLRDEGLAYAKALREAGTHVIVHRFPHLVHGFVHLLGVSRSSRAALKELAQAVRRRLS